MTPTVPKKPFSEFRALLQLQREQLLREVREKIAASGEGLGFANQSQFTDDDAVADAAAQMDVAMVIRESQDLQNIEAALARIDDGSYGYCLETGEEIGIKRLEARPVATLSVEAQERRERRE